MRMCKLRSSATVFEFNEHTVLHGTSEGSEEKQATIPLPLSVYAKFMAKVTSSTVYLTLPLLFSQEAIPCQTLVMTRHFQKWRCHEISMTTLASAL